MIYPNIDAGLYNWTHWADPVIGRVSVRTRANGETYASFCNACYYWNVCHEDIVELQPTICAHRPLLLDYAPYRQGTYD